MLKASKLKKPNIRISCNNEGPREIFGNKVRLLTKRKAKPIEKSRPIVSLEMPCSSSQMPQKGKNTPQIKRKEMKYKLSHDLAAIENK